jgi:hypothetical protein
MNRLGGWARIGIVISILWSLAVFGSAANEYFIFSKERNHNLSLPPPPKGFVIEPKVQGKFFEWRPVVDLLVKDTSAYVPDFQVQGCRLLVVWLSPIIALWVFSIVVVFTFKWVKVGFTKKD